MQWPICCTEEYFSV